MTSPQQSAQLEGKHSELVEKYFDDNAQDWSELYGEAKRVNDLVLAARRRPQRQPRSAGHDWPS